MTSYQLTINNDEFMGYEQETLFQCDTCPTYHLEQIAQGIFDKLNDFACNYVAISMEKGTHVHIHAYVQLAYKPQTMAAWQKMFPGVHVETCRGTPQQNMDYLAKQGKWENDEKHGTLRWGPITHGEMLGLRGTPEDYVKLARIANSFTDVLVAYPEAMRYGWSIKQIIDERGKNNGKD